MSSVLLNPGRYWIGNPIRVFTDWEPNPTCTYTAGPYAYHAFKYESGYVAAIPEDAIPKEFTKNKDYRMSRTEFFAPATFWEVDGKGYIDKIEL